MTKAAWLRLAVALLALLLWPSRALAQGTPLQAVDWLAVLAAEPGVQASADCPPAFGGRAPCLLVALGGDQVAGYPLVDNVLYGDIDGDGLDEAVIPLFSGGTAGTIGFLVYHQAEPRPRLVASQSGYKLGLSIGGGQLIVDEPYYFSGDPNCCPTALVRRPYRLSGGALVGGAETWLEPSGESDRPLTVAEVVVRGFYNALDRHALDDAYAFFTPRFQVANPFPTWAAGYRDTESVTVDTRPGASPTEVAVTIQTTERGAPDALPPRRFAGTWRLVPSDTAPLGLLLDQASIAPQP
ncbi:MAG TPA: hypothetical protein VK066_21915 [Chloroflexota bacterium]|nr:hypothetical protein [Chloroflexota bacterium]